uniref:Uncharacterized protein n=1 Tax=viral metagenome TaxID=1070528 RepID=A0A6C0EB11_9ZZZZ
MAEDAEYALNEIVQSFANQNCQQVYTRVIEYMAINTISFSQEDFNKFAVFYQNCRPQNEQEMNIWDVPALEEFYETAAEILMGDRSFFEEEEDISLTQPADEPHFETPPGGED